MTIAVEVAWIEEHGHLRCPKCGAHLMGRETLCEPRFRSHHFVCYCGTKISVTDKTVDV